MAATEHVAFFQELYELLSPRPCTNVSQRLRPSETFRLPNLQHERFKLPSSEKEKENFVSFQVKVLKFKDVYHPNLPKDVFVVDLKRYLQEQGAGEMESMRLVFKGKAMTNDKTLEEYGVTQGAVVQLVRKTGMGQSISTPSVVMKTSSGVKPMEMDKITEKETKPWETEEFWKRLKIWMIKETHHDEETEKVVLAMRRGVEEHVQSKTTTS